MPTGGWHGGCVGKGFDRRERESGRGMGEGRRLERGIFIPVRLLSVLLMLSSMSVAITKHFSSVLKELTPLFLSFFVGLCVVCV